MIAVERVSEARRSAPILGKTVKEAISGVAGVVRAVQVYHTGCNNVLVQRKGTDKEGNPYPTMWMEFTGLVGFEKLPETERPDILGKKVKDIITGYTGVVVSMTIMDSYDTRVYVQGNTRTDEGIPSPEHVCDLTHLVRLDKKPIKKTDRTGAPAFLSRAIPSALRK